MITKILVLIDFMFKISSYNISNGMYKSFVAEHQYMGEKFPVKYLTPEEIVPTVSDLNHYVKSLRRNVDYFSMMPNNTNCNKALGLFYTKSLLKRTLQDDYDNVKNNNQGAIIKDIIGKAENILSHYIYINSPYGWGDLEYRVSRLFKLDEPQVYSIGNFNRNKLKKWIYATGKMHEFLKEIDGCHSIEGDILALCSMLGYEEFHRRHWFHKSASWIDENGCMQENRNFEINRTRIQLDGETNPKQLKKLRGILKWLLNADCHNHPMAMSVVVLAHGIRHAAHFLSDKDGERENSVK